MPASAVLHGGFKEHVALCMFPARHPGWHQTWRFPLPSKHVLFPSLPDASHRVWHAVRSQLLLRKSDGENPSPPVSHVCSSCRFHPVKSHFRGTLSQGLLPTCPCSQPKRKGQLLETWGGGNASTSCSAHSALSCTTFQ